jgi:hypothetical protein
LRISRRTWGFGAVLNARWMSAGKMEALQPLHSLRLLFLDVYFIEDIKVCDGGEEWVFEINGTILLVF